MWWCGWDRESKRLAALTGWQRKALEPLHTICVYRGHACETTAQTKKWGSRKKRNKVTVPGKNHIFSSLLSYNGLFQFQNGVMVTENVTLFWLQHLLATFGRMLSSFAYGLSSSSHYSILSTVTVELLPLVSEWSWGEAERAHLLSLKIFMFQRLDMLYLIVFNNELESVYGCVSLSLSTLFFKPNWDLTIASLRRWLFFTSIHYLSGVLSNQLDRTQFPYLVYPFFCITPYIHSS